MAQTSGRYTNSPETQIESDLARFRDLDPGDADSFCEVLNKIVRDTMTTDYWDITGQYSVGAESEISALSVQSMNAMLAMAFTCLVSVISFAAKWAFGWR